MTSAQPTILVLGAGLAGCTAALELASRGQRVTLLDRAARPMLGASRHNEGKLHLGYVYGADPDQRTHRILAEGSLRFFDILTRLTAAPRDLHRVSGPFTYVVPEDSARSVDAVQDYFQQVDRTVAEHCATLGQPALPPTAPAAVGPQYSDRVRAAFHTPEIAVDPGRLSDIVSAAVYAHPLIDFRDDSLVLAAQGHADGYVVTVRQADDTVTLRADGVINALWEDRVRMDAMIGLATPHVWSQRWKATVTIDIPRGSIDLPSTTALVGPYGDFVLYGDDRIYLSWYPALRLSMSTTATPDDVRAMVESTDLDAIRAQALRGLATLIPQVTTLDQFAPSTRVGGGFILAVGASDIDDATSGLHRRDQIGVESAQGWISISTGKFCTAPMFGVDAAQTLMEQFA